MDDKNQQQPVTPPAPSLAQVSPNPAAPPKPEEAKPPIPVEAAQALLEISGTASVQHKRKGGMSLGLIISLITVVILVIAASFALSSYKPNKGSGTNGSGTSAEKGVTNEINQDVNTCTNAAKAAAEC